MHTATLLMRLDGTRWGHLRAGTYFALIRSNGGLIPGGPSNVVLCPDVASLTVDQFGCRNCFDVASLVMVQAKSHA